MPTSNYNIVHLSDDKCKIIENKDSVYLMYSTIKLSKSQGRGGENFEMPGKWGMIFPTVELIFRVLGTKTTQKGGGYFYIDA